jgi:myosin heavy subunit
VYLYYIFNIIKFYIIKHETNKFNDYIPKSSLNENKNKSRSRRSSITKENIVNNNSIINDLNNLKSRINNDYISIDEYDKLKEELDKQIKINEQLNTKINELQNLLIKENIKNSDLKKQISNVNEDKKKLSEVSAKLGNKLQNENEKMNESLIKTTNDLNEAKKKIEKYLKSLKYLNIEIQNKDKELLSLYKENGILKKKLSRFPFELGEDEKMIILTFQSNENQISHHIICKNTDIFSEIEVKLKNKYPNLKEEENYYLHNGKKINKNYSLQDNNIGDGDTIIICKIDV